MGAGRLHVESGAGKLLVMSLGPMMGSHGAHPAVGVADALLAHAQDLVHVELGVLVAVRVHHRLVARLRLLAVLRRQPIAQLRADASGVSRCQVSESGCPACFAPKPVEKACAYSGSRS